MPHRTGALPSDACAWASAGQRGASAYGVQRAALERLRKWVGRWRRCLAVAAIEQGSGSDVDALDLAHRELLERLVLLRLVELTAGSSSRQLLRVVSSSPNTVLYRTFFQEAGRQFGTVVAAIDASAGELPWVPVDSEGSPRHTLQGLVGSLYEEASPVLTLRPDEALGFVHEQSCATVLRLQEGAVTLEPRALASRAKGVHYSPSWAVEHIVEVALKAWAAHDACVARAPAVLDPACGAGAFLCGTLRMLFRARAERRGASPGSGSRDGAGYLAGDRSLDIAEKARILTESIHGVDLDPISVHRARVALLLTLLDGEGERCAAAADVLAGGFPPLSRRIKSGNSLVDPGARACRFGVELERSAFDWYDEFPEVMGAGGFDVIVGNPPHVDAESMTRHAPNLRAYCCERYAAARGNWDLFCVFIERAIELQRPGGVQSLIVPNKLVSAEYSSELRRLMMQHDLDRLEDLSALRLFSADSYPVVFVLRKRAASARSTEGSGGQGDGVLTDDGAAPSLHGRRPGPCRRSELGAPWSLGEPGPSGEMAARIVAARDCYETLDLPHVAVSGGATVNEAYMLLAELREAQPGDAGAVPVVNSGTIDRYGCNWGQTQMRYLKSSFLHPVVSEAALEALSPKRLRQAKSVKCIVAGLTRCLEVFPDVEGRYLAAKSTTIIVSRAPGLAIEYLAALFNSSLLSRIYARLYGGLRLGGDYLRVGPPQLRRMPLVVPCTDRELSLARELSALAAERIAQSSGKDREGRRAVSPPPDRRSEASDHASLLLDESIDELVDALYLERLTAPRQPSGHPR